MRKYADDFRELWWRVLLTVVAGDAVLFGGIAILTAAKVPATPVHWFELIALSLAVALLTAWGLANLPARMPKALRGAFDETPEAMLAALVAEGKLEIRISSEEEEDA